MKKIISAVMAVIISLCLAGCEKEPEYRNYDFYNGFEKQYTQEIAPVAMEKFTDKTEAENNRRLIDEVGLDGLRRHEVMKKYREYVVNFYFGDWATEQRFYAAKDYAYNTFWEGNLSIGTTLPYENWEHREQVRILTIQVWCNDKLVMKDSYTFTWLSAASVKNCESTSEIYPDIRFDGQILDINDYLSGERELIAEYCDMSRWRGDGAVLTMRQTGLSGEKVLYMEISLPQGQMNPEKLNEMYDVIHDRFDFINDNIIIQLYTGDRLYYEYSSPVQLPQESDS